jgi:hypothetical protein
MAAGSSRRYAVARAMGEEELQKVVKEDEQLLQEFGLRLLSVESGVSAAIEKQVKGKRINPWDVMRFDDSIWSWLRPLLVEMREHREHQQVAVARAAK